MASPAIPSHDEQMGATAPHIVFIPSAGMGHMLPFFRFASTLSSNGCEVSVVTVVPTVSTAEADHFAALFAEFPRIRRVDFHLAPFDDTAFPAADPFVLRWEALRRSAHLFPALLTGATPRASAVIADVTLASHVIPIAGELHLPCYVLFISSATMLSFLARFPTYLDTRAEPGIGGVDIPGLRCIPKMSVPQPLHNPGNLFTAQFVKNGREIAKADGILVNTFEALELEALRALREGVVVPGFPPVFAVGPLKSMSSGASGNAEAHSSPFSWLDAQPARSVVYVAFGNRCTVSREQLKEIAIGLEASGCRFLWVVKTTVVDREDDAELNELLGEEFLEKVKGWGVVTKAWVEQEHVLKHPAVGLFLTHSGWNSVTEAAAAGVPMLAWPRGGDHRVNATVVASSGIGVWMEHWSWDGEEAVVSGEEIAAKVKEMVGNKKVMEKAARLGEEAAKAVAEGGTSCRSLAEFVAKLKL